MRTVRVMIMLLVVVAFSIAVSAQTGGPQASSGQTNTSATAQRVVSGAPLQGGPGGCGGGCGQNPQPTSKAAPVLQTIPGSNESVLVGQVENLVPISAVTVLGCEKCAMETVTWALHHGSSYDDVDRVLRMLAAMQKLECFNQQFGPDTAARMEKSLAAGRGALQQEMARAEK